MCFMNTTHKYTQRIQAWFSITAEQMVASLDMDRMLLVALPSKRKRSPYMFIFIGLGTSKTRVGRILEYRIGLKAAFIYHWSGKL